MQMSTFPFVKNLFVRVRVRFRFRLRFGRQLCRFRRCRFCRDDARSGSLCARQQLAVHHVKELVGVQLFALKQHTCQTVQQVNVLGEHFLVLSYASQMMDLISSSISAAVSSE